MERIIRMPTLELITPCKKATIYQLTTMLDTSITVLFSGHNHLLTTSNDDLFPTGARVVIKVLGHQYQFLAGYYNLEIVHF